MLLPVEIALIVLGIVAALWRPSAGWVERSFSNGYYPKWQHFWSSFTPAIPFSFGDAVAIAGAALVIAALAFRRPFWRALMGVAVVAAVYVVWFYAGWGFGYDRQPLEARADFEQSRITAAAIDALRARVIASMNRLAPVAHRLTKNDPRRYADLRAAWIPVVQRLGDRWTPRVDAPKPTLAGWFMDRSGTSGFTNPFTLETQLAPDLLWFERPFSQAHEWSHVAGFNREDEANYIAAVTCLRDRDPVARYSGMLDSFCIFRLCSTMHARRSSRRYGPTLPPFESETRTSSI